MIIPDESVKSIFAISPSSSCQNFWFRPPWIARAFTLNSCHKSSSFIVQRCFMIRPSEHLTSYETLLPVAQTNNWHSLCSFRADVSRLRRLPPLWLLSCLTGRSLIPSSTFLKLRKWFIFLGHSFVTSPSKSFSSVLLSFLQQSSLHFQFDSSCHVQNPIYKENPFLKK